MSNYQLVDVLDSKTKITYASYVYNDPAFLRSNNNFVQHHFYWVADSCNEAHAHVAFSIADNIAYSPHRLPFGGLEVSLNLSERSIAEFLEAVEIKLKSLSIKAIRIHQAPNAYFNQSLINGALITHGFDIIQERVFHAITVDQSDIFERMHKMEQRKIKKCRDACAEFKELKKSEKVKAFEWIERFRTLDYKPPSMTWVDLEDVNQRNPKLYKVFGVFIDGHMLAATVLVMVNKQAVYHFMPASHVDFPGYKKFSPMVFLVEGLYNWCQSNGIKTLDLGTSYVEMKMKASLAQFKENIGGKSSEAYSWEKILSS